MALSVSIVALVMMMAPASFAAMDPNSYTYPLSDPFPSDPYSADQYIPMQYPSDASFNQYKMNLQMLNKQLMETFLKAQIAYDYKTLLELNIISPLEYSSKMKELKSAQNNLDEMYKKYQNSAMNYMNSLSSAMPTILPSNTIHIM